LVVLLDEIAVLLDEIAPAMKVILTIPTHLSVARSVYRVFCLNHSMDLDELLQFNDIFC